MKRIFFIVFSFCSFSLGFSITGDSIVFSYSGLKSTFIRLHRLYTDCEYLSIQRFPFASASHILTLNKAFSPLTGLRNYILNFYPWDLYILNDLYKCYFPSLSNSLLIGPNCCYMGFCPLSTRYDSKTKIRYMLHDRTNNRLILCELASIYLNEYDTNPHYFTYLDSFNVSKISVRKDLSPKSAGFGHIVDKKRYDVIIETDREDYSEGSSSRLSILSNYSGSTDELWKSERRIGVIRQMEIFDIDNDSLDEVIIQPIAEIYCKRLFVYKFQNNNLEMLINQPVACTYGFSWCIADVDNDGTGEIITLGDSPINRVLHSDILRLSIYKYNRNEKKLNEILIRDIGTNKNIRYYDLEPIGLSEINDKWKIFFSHPGGFNIKDSVDTYYLDEVTCNDENESILGKEDQNKKTKTIQYEPTEGERLILDMKYKLALRYYREIVDNNPRDSTAWFYIAFCYTKLNEYAKAISICEDTLLAIYPNYANAMQHLAYCYRKLGDNKKALEWLKKAEKILQKK